MVRMNAEHPKMSIVFSMCGSDERESNDVVILHQDDRGVRVEGFGSIEEMIEEGAAFLFSLVEEEAVLPSLKSHIIARV